MGFWNQERSRGNTACFRNAVERSRNAKKRSGDAAEHSGNTREHSGDAAERSGNTAERSGNTGEHSGDAAEHSGAPVKHSAAEVERSGSEIKDSTAPVEHSGEAVEHSATGVPPSEVASTRAPPSGTHHSGLAMGGTGSQRPCQLRDLKKRDGQQTMSRKTSNGDTLIRDQLKAFLGQLSFHKGTFFLTADKSNSALGQAEGLHSIYFPPAYGRSTIHMSEVLLPPHLEYEGERLTMTVPVGKLIYEMAVQFGTLFVSANGTSVRLECDSRGDSLEYWISRRLRIDPMEVAKLEARYRQSARVPLGLAEAFWEAEPKGRHFW